MLALCDTHGSSIHLIDPEEHTHWPPPWFFFFDRCHNPPGPPTHTQWQPVHPGFCKAFGFQPRNPSTHPSCAPPPPPPPTQARERTGGRPPHPPPPHLPQLGSHRRGPPPPQGRGGTPPLRRNGDAVRATAAGPAPANPHRRAGATRTAKRDGGRAPHDPPVTTSHSEVTEGGFRSAGAPGGAVHGPPLTPPPRDGTSAPTARARQKGARWRHGEGQKEVPQAAARSEGREAAARHPPPPPPHQPASRGGPGPHPPRQGGWAPPAREGSRSVTRPPAPAAGSHGGRKEQAGPRLRTGTPHRSYPEKPEWYGGPRPPWTAQHQ